MITALDSGDSPRRRYIFISYSRKDQKYVDRLVRHLARAGIDVWHDDDLRAGERFGAVIENQISGCAAVVVVLSPHAVASRWVDREIAYAEYAGKPIFPLLLAPSDIPIALITTQYEDVTSGRMPGDRFVDRLRRVTEVAGTATEVNQQASDEPGARGSGAASAPSTEMAVMDATEFERTWQRILAMAGETFRTKTGLPFTYSAHQTSIVPDRTDYPLHVSQFRAALERMPLHGPGEISHVRGSSYVYAILTDPRIDSTP